jgi:hypothetical protein
MEHRCIILEHFQVSEPRFDSKPSDLKKRAPFHISTLFNIKSSYKDDAFNDTKLTLSIGGTKKLFPVMSYSVRFCFFLFFERFCHFSGTFFFFMCPRVLDSLLRFEEGFRWLHSAALTFLIPAVPSLLLAETRKQRFYNSTSFDWSLKLAACAEKR